MPTALISVSDKDGVVDFARSLTGKGWTIVSTGGTARELMGEGVSVTMIERFTGFPEILEGRVKTLHPAVHAGILARRSVSTDMQELSRHDLETIDLVAVNLYPFRETVARGNVTLAQAQDQIDIGGPTLLRAAAKNHAFVWPVCDPADYDDVLEALEDEDTLETRRRLASKVFYHTATYDTAIAGYLQQTTRPRGEQHPDELPEEMLWSLVQVQELRYGENPDQEAAFYREAAGEAWGIPALRQRHGKELSYNNLLDVDGALTALAPFLGDEEGAACAIIKHTTPCGIAVGRSAAEAYEKALACDPMSAFGSVVAFNQPVTETLAEELAEQYVECVVAPGYASPGLHIMKQAKEDMRILETRGGAELGRPRGQVRAGLEARGVHGGLLVQRTPEPVRPWGLAEADGVEVPTERRPSEEEWRDLGFAWAAVQSVKSNAILLARDGASIGIGAGQMSRVDAVRIATRKAGEFDHAIRGSVLASDAFFPFRDGVDAAADAGVSAVVQPGGSIRDDEVVAACDEHGIAMVLTGRRVFRH
jgi:phosphoribosylaminoimidazolecarboxamide formyltransferase/IMP cyclohydrolase